MFLNVTINNRVNARVSFVSEAYLRNLQRNVMGEVSRVIDEGDTQVARVIAEGDTQEARVTDEGDTQVARVIAEGDTQEARVIAEGDTQVARAVVEADRAEAEADRAVVEADRAEAEADRATEQADEIKAVTVVAPVTGLPPLAGNIPATPTVTYDPLTGAFTYGIPIGATGSPALAILPQGGRTVAELNALVADPIIGAGYFMEDLGTVTYGIEDAVVANVNEILVWVQDGSFINIGLLPTGNTWGGITNVSVDGLAPVNGDNLARRSTTYTKVEQDAIDLAQDNAIALNTAKVTGADRVLKTGDTMTGSLVMEYGAELHGEPQDASATRTMVKINTTGEVEFGDASATSRGLGNWAFGGNPPVIDLSPTATSHAVRKDYVDAQVSANGTFIGMVAMYDGLVANIPAGWGLMNLDNVVIVATQVEADFGTTGGSNDAVSINHTHGADFAGVNVSGSLNFHGSGAGTVLSSTAGVFTTSAENTSYGATTVTGGANSYGVANFSLTPSGTVTIIEDGADGTNLNMQAYVKMGFIRRDS